MQGRIGMARATVSVLVGGIALAGCTRSVADPARATRAYPYELHLVETVDAEGNLVRAPRVADVHIFRDDIWLEIVNTTPRSYENFDVWVNQAFVRRVDALPAGGRIRLSLFEFYDELGERFNAGGFFRAVEPDPVRLVEVQPAEDEPLIGLIAIRAEDLK
ncbi:MAG: hypothetical protein ACYTJ0_17945 [Planctomycetota bacterium]|jgi:hypothetical protein